ncbi:MAG: GtrA family protein [Parvularculaceae bacterium]
MIDKAKTIFKGHGRGAALFAMVGVLNLTTDFLVYSAGVFLGVHPVVANFISFFCANLQSYRVNAAITFRRDGVAAPVSVRGYVKFALAHILGLAISTGFILALADKIGPIGAKGVAVVFAAASNYTMSALFVFKRDNKPASGADPV